MSCPDHVIEGETLPACYRLQLIAGLTNGVARLRQPEKCTSVSPAGMLSSGEKDLAAQLRKRPDLVASALNVLLCERRVQKAPLTGYWKLNVE
jgi:hypothetical protein